jgi:hypothetical protein
MFGAPKGSMDSFWYTQGIFIKRKKEILNLIVYTVHYIFHFIVHFFFGTGYTECKQPIVFSSCTTLERRYQLYFGQIHGDLTVFMTKSKETRTEGCTHCVY